jgi:hypothetical protein
MRFNLGLGIIGTFTSVIGMLTFAKVWEPTFTFYNIPMIVIYVVLPVSFIGACWWIGYLYDVKGIWKEETSHQNMKLNPEFLTVLSNMEHMVKNLDALTVKIDKLITDNKKEVEK